MLVQSAHWLQSYSSGSTLQSLLELSNDQLGQRKRLLCGLSSLNVCTKQLTCVIRPPSTGNTALPSERLYVNLKRFIDTSVDGVDDSSHDPEQLKASELVQQMISNHNLCFLSSDKIIGNIDLNFLSISQNYGCIFYGLAKENGWLYIFMRTLTSTWSVLSKLQLLVKEENTLTCELRHVWVDEERHEVIWWQCRRIVEDDKHNCYHCSLELTNSNNPQEQMEVKMSPSVLLWQGSGATLIQHSSNNSLWILSSSAPSAVAITVIDLISSQRYTHHLSFDTFSTELKLDFLPDLSSTQEQCNVKLITYNRHLYLCYFPHRDMQKRGLQVVPIRLSTSSLSNASSAVAVIATHNNTNNDKGKHNHGAVIVYLLVLCNRVQAEIHRIFMSLFPSSQSRQQHKSYSSIKTEVVTTLRIPGQSLGDQLHFITGDSSMVFGDKSGDKDKKGVVSKPIMFTRPTNKLISLQLPVHDNSMEESCDTLFAALEALYNHNKVNDDEYTLTSPVNSTRDNLMKALDMLKPINNNSNTKADSKNCLIEHAGQFLFDLTQQSGCWEEKHIPSSTPSSSITPASNACYIRWRQNRQVQDQAQEEEQVERKNVWEQLILESDSWIHRQYQQFIYTDHTQLLKFALDNNIIDPGNMHDEDNDSMRRISVDEDIKESQFLLDIHSHTSIAADTETNQEQSVGCAVIEVDIITLHPVESIAGEGTRQECMEHIGKTFTPEALLMILSYTLYSHHDHGVGDDNVDMSISVTINEDHIPLLKQFINPIHMMILHQLLHNPYDLPTLVSSLLFAQQLIIHQQQQVNMTLHRSRASNNGESSTPWSVLQSVSSQEFFYDTQPQPYQAEMVTSPRPDDSHRAREDELEDIFGLALFDEKRYHDEDYLDDSMNISASSVRSISPRPIPTKQQLSQQQQREEERLFDLSDLLSFFASSAFPNSKNQARDEVPKIQQPMALQQQLWQIPQYAESTRCRSDSRLSQLHSNQDEEDHDEISDNHYFKRLVSQALLHALRLHFQAKLNSPAANDSPFAHLFQGIDSDPQQRRVIYHLFLMVDRPVAAVHLMLIWHDNLACNYLMQRIQASADVINALTLTKHDHYRPELDMPIIEYHLQVVPTAHEDAHRLQCWKIFGQAGKSSRLIKRLNPLFERPWSVEEIEEELEIWRQEADRGLSEKREQQLAMINTVAKK